MRLERLDEQEFIRKISRAQKWNISISALLREYVLTVYDDYGNAWHYAGPDPNSTPAQEYDAFQIMIAKLPDEVKLRRIDKIEEGS